MEERLLRHDSYWLYCRDLLGKGGIPLETFDTLTTKRITRIIKLQEERLKKQHEELERQREEQDKKMKNANKKRQ